MPPSDPHPSDSNATPDIERAIRRIGCVSTGRADAGIYRPLLSALASQRRWEVTCFAGGTHLSQRFGRTLDTLQLPDHVRVVPVDHLCEGDGPCDVAETAGRATTQFSRAFAAAGLDLLFVLGDRTEMLAAALAAVIHRIPIAHLHGGELTRGSYDDQCRHALTKLAHLHFASLPEYADRIAAMGEEPWRIHTVGAPALDALADFEPECVETLSLALGCDFSQPTYVVALHAETLSDVSPRDQAARLLDALGRTEANLLFVGTNADVGHDNISDSVQCFVANRPGAVLAASMPHSRFWSCLSHARLMIGNSSAGIIEAASFKLPVVNIGDRQAGRVRPANVIDTRWNPEDITAAINRATSGPFRNSTASLSNPYGNGQASRQIVAALGTLPNRRTLLLKRQRGERNTNSTQQ